MLKSSAGDDFPSLFAGVRSEIDDPVGKLDCEGIVFDEQKGIAHRAQIFEGFIEALIIVWVESDGRLVQDVEAPRESTAELAS